MSDAHVYQIYYSEITRGQIDPGFLPLDNTTNQRPDWREYWPIRNFLAANSLVEDDYYGFLSPKFRSKTKLDSDAVNGFLRRGAGNADAVLFCPYFEQGAMHWNTLEQGMLVHPEARAAFRQCAPLIAPAFHADATVNSSANSVYCNYFAAKPRFWRVWLRSCESIFAIAEARATLLGDLLNAQVPYDNGTAPAKVFVIERVASMLLASDAQWKSIAYRPLTRFNNDSVSTFKFQLATLDALKIAHGVQGHQEYRDAFMHLRAALSNAVHKKG